MEGFVGLKKLSKLYFQNILQLFFTLERKLEGDAFTQIINLHDVSFCKIMSGKEKNSIIQKLIEVTKIIASEIVECCSRAGTFHAPNMTFGNQSFLSMMPSGFYRVSLRFFDVTDDNIINTTTTFTVGQ